MTTWLREQILLVFVYVLIDTTAIASESSCQICQLTHYRLPDFDEMSVSDLPLTTKGGLGKLWMCTRMCSEDSRCRSYRYNSVTGVCSTYGVGYSTPGNTLNTVSIEIGSQLYLMCGETHAFGTACSTTSECEYAQSSCKTGFCGCSVGYSFDVNTGNCVTHCAQYTDLFEKYPDHGVIDCNNLVVNQLSNDTCMEACREESTFVCINVEYEISTGKCNMCDKAWFDLDPGARETNVSGWVLYYRQCAL